MMNMKTLLAFTASIAVLGTLTACQTPASASAEVSSEHVPVVSQQYLTHDMAFGPRGDLSAAELNELDQWFESIDVRYGDRVSVDQTGAGENPLRKAAISRVLGTRGLMLASESPATAPAITAGTVRVVVVRATASVPECPDVDNAPNPDPTVSKTSNYGCATSSNLAAMIADPNDLLSGKDFSGEGSERAAKAIAKQRATMTNGSVASSVGSVN